MITSRLWYAIHIPPRGHPLYRRITQPARRLYTPLSDIHFSAGGLLRLAFAILIVPFIITGGATLMLPVLCFVPALLPIGLLLVGNLYGADSAVSASLSMTSERQQGTYDLLCMTPTGSLGMGWATCTGHLYRHGIGYVLRLFALFVKLAVAILSITLFIVVMRAVALQPEIYANQLGTDIMNFTYALTLLIAIVADFAQPIILGSTLGMLIPTYRLERFDTGIMALGSFLALQMVAYVITWAIGFVLIPDGLMGLGIAGTGVHILLAITRLLLFVGTREVMIMLLWRKLRQRLNAIELDAVPHLAISFRA